MSSISSVSGVSSLTSFVVKTTNEKVQSRLKMYTCPKCSNPYDIILRNNMYVGRVPLILNCNHSMCEECIKHSLHSKYEITCSDCDETFVVDNIENRKLQDVFSVNFYLLGLIYYSRLNMSEVSKINLKPAGVRYKDRLTLENKNSDVVDFQVFNLSVVDESCSQDNCKRAATLICTDCDEVYCNICCTTLHKAARGLQSHKISPKSSEFIPEINSKCATHKDSLLEFDCKPCNMMLCCYCVLQNHHGHEYYQLTNLEERDCTNFMELVKKAEEKLKKFLLVHKKIKTEVSTLQHYNHAPLVEKRIGKYFSNLHAQLQAAEKKVLAETHQAKNSNFVTLNQINNDVLANIRSLNGLLIAAKEFSKPNSKIKINVKTIIERLENALRVPCYLVGEEQKLDHLQFVFEEEFLDLEDKFNINVDADYSTYRLVDENEVSSSDEAAVLDEIKNTSLSEFGLDRATHNPSDVLLNSLSPKPKPVSAVVEGWIKQTTQVKCVMPVLKAGDREKIIVTHIESPESFYVQLIRLNNYLNNFTKDINTYIKNFPPVVNEPELNELYIVKYETNKRKPEWYRGRIVEIINNNDEEDTYVVMFIDYGNTKTVKRNLLREINKELKKPKPFALHCGLKNCYPANKEWNIKAMGLMVEIIEEADVVMVVLDNKITLEVDLLTSCGNDNLGSLRDALVFIGHGVPSLDAAGPITELAMKTVVSDCKIYQRTDNFTKDKIFDVYISYVVNPHKVYVQVVNFAHSVKHLSDVMKNYYNNNKATKNNRTNKENIYVPKKGMIAAVQANIGCGFQWCRCTVTETLIGRGMVEAFLVDYGHTITVPYTHLKKLPEKFRTMDRQALLVKMVDIKPREPTWDRNAINFLNKYANNSDVIRLVVATVADNIEVLLFECHSSIDVCINSLMVSENLAISSGVLSEKVKWLRGEKKGDKEESYSFSLIKTIQGSKEESESEDSDLNENTDRKSVSVLSAKSPDLIYVSLDDEKSKKLQSQLHCDLQIFYTTAPVKLEEPQPGETCVAFKKISKQYFRSVILESLEGDNFKVMLKDLGQELVVHKNDLFVLDEEFKQFFEGAIKCHLTGVLPAGDPKKWSALAIEFFSDIFQNKNKFVIAKNGLLDAERKSLPIIMWYTEIKPGGALEPPRISYHNINKLLISQGLALKPRGEMSVPSVSKMVVSPRKSESEGDCNNKGSLSSTSDTMVGSSSPQSSGLSKKKILTKKRSSTTHSGSKTSSNSNSSIHTLSATEPEDESVDKPIVCTTYDAKDWNKLIEEENAPPVDWKPAETISKMNFEALVTNVDESANIYIHEIDMTPALKCMEEEMKKAFDNVPAEPAGFIWVPGQICTVKYFATESWYRGKILNINNDNIQVFMIDYGNIEECTHEDLRFKVLYSNIPAFANKIHLDNVTSKHKKWLTSDLDELHTLLVDNQISVTLKQAHRPNTSPAADIHLDDLHVNQYMLDVTNSLMPLSEKRNVSSDSDDVIIEDDVLVEEDDVILSSIPKFTEGVIPSSLKGKKKHVGVISIISYNKFILEIVPDHVEETKTTYEKMAQELVECGHEQPIVYDLNINQACIALFSEDDNYYRGKVIKNSNNGFVMIWFVDFGNYEDVPRDCVRVIKPEWLQIPVYQHRAELCDVEIVDKSMMAVAFDRLSQLCNSVKKAKFVSIEPLKVQLYEDDKKLCYQDLIEENIFKLKTSDV